MALKMKLASILNQITRALENAAELIKSEKLSGFVDARYKGWDSGMGKKMLDGKADLDDMAAYALETNSSPAPISGRQEHLENIVTYHTK